MSKVIIIPRDIPRRSLIKILKENDDTLLKYTDADGNLQERRGTLMAGIIPAIQGEIGGDNKEVVVYWDLEKKDWRSFRLDQFRGGKYTIH